MPSCESSGLPTTHYFVSLSRGDSIRTAMVRPAALWGFFALTLLSLATGAAGAGYFLLHDALLRGALTRASEIETTYGIRLAEARGRLDEAESRRLIEAKALGDRVKALYLREQRLERRDRALAQLAAAAGPAPPADALSTIETASPQAEQSEPDPDARAYAPTSRDPGAASELGGERSPDQKAHIDGLTKALDAIETAQIATAGAIGASAARVSANESAAVIAAGLDPAKLTPPKATAAVGGPFIPLGPEPEASAFDRAAAEAAAKVAAGERLRLVMPFLPFLKPLAGQSAMSSPFGYRIDPFLGRPALHPGVDLVEDYGAEVRAAGAGRVVRAGSFGGYGMMVEIDHGNGLATRYGHLSEVSVAEGEEVAQGGLIGRIGSSGRSTGPHLHYEVRINDEPVDPERFISAGERLARAD